MFLFEVASRHMTWLAERQSVTASNIANANTPGYRAKDIEPFSTVLDGTSLNMTATSPHHLSVANNASTVAATQSGASWDASHSGNNVSMEQELMKAGSTSRMMSLDVSLTRSFHRMLLASLKV